MNDAHLKELIASAYPTVDPTDDVKGRVRARVVRKTKTLHRWKLGSVGPSTSVLVASLAAYPVVEGNRIAYAIAQSMRSVDTFTVTIKALSNGVTKVAPPTTIATLDGVSFIPYASSRIFAMADEEENLRVYHPDSNVVVLHRNVKMGLQAPKKVMEDLEKFGWDKRVQSVTVDGRQLQQLVLKEGNQQAIWLFEPVTRLPLQMNVKVQVAQGPPFEIVWSFDYDAKKVRALYHPPIEEMESATVIDISRDGQPMADKFAKNPLASIKTSRDLLRVYDVRQDASGNVFVLYTFKGYHGSEERREPHLHMKDSQGAKWLTSTFDLNFCRWKIDGQYPKAQVFFHPERQMNPEKVSLYLRAKGGAFMPDQVEQRRPRKDFSSDTVKVLTTAPVQGNRPPLWFFYSFGVKDEQWLAAQASKLRIMYGIKNARYSATVGVGKELEKAFPHMLVGFFYEPRQLYLDLAEAYVGLGQKENARSYLQKAMNEKKASDDYFFEQNLKRIQRKLQAAG